MTLFKSLLLLIVAVSWFEPTVFAQEKSGMSLSNYGGINSVRLNPAFLTNSKLYYDINFISGATFLQNNFLFIHKEDYNPMSFLKLNPELPSTDVRGEGLDYNPDTDLIRAFEQAELGVLSFSIALGDHAFGVSTRAITMSTLSNVPGYLGQLSYEGIDYEPLYGIDQNNEKFEAAAAGWWEIGFSYAYKLKKRRYDEWSLGANVRRMWGYAGAHLVSYNADYTVVNENNIDIRNLDAAVGFSIPIDYNTNEYPAPGKTFKGRGYVFDLGISYVKKRSLPYNRNYQNYCSVEYEDYVYKVGVSLLDLGSLKFTQNGEQHLYDNVSANWESIDTLEYRSINDFTRVLSEVFYGDPNASEVDGDKFKLGMPAALSLQADYQYFHNWHIASMLILPMSFGKSQLYRPGQALLSLRYETDIFEVALPVSLYDFRELRLGLSARIYYFTIGTEKLGGFFSLNDFYGMDIYFSLKFHIIRGWCGRYKVRPDCRGYNF